jgi:hypothetical protein
MIILKTTMMKTKTLAFKFLLFSLLLITLTSGIYRHDRPVEKYLALASEERFDCAGELIKLRNGKWIGGGSFVLIDSVTILSAAHCFIEEIKKDTIVNYQGQQFKTYITIGKSIQKPKDFRFHIFNAHLLAKSITVHPDYLKDGSCDLAIIKLDKPVAGFKSLQVNSSVNEVGDTATGVGFGVSGPANRPELVNSYHIKLAGQNMIDSIGGALLNGKFTMLYADFDHPEKVCNKTGDPKPIELEYAIGGGDSGGPLFSYKNNTLCLIGIAAYGQKSVAGLLKNGYYCELMGWTRVSAFADWISKNK